MFNREYQKRATRQGIRSFVATAEFYRPAVRPMAVRDFAQRKRRNRSWTVPPEQMKLDFSTDRPLNDVFPEAYE